MTTIPSTLTITPVSTNVRRGLCIAVVYSLRLPIHRFLSLIHPFRFAAHRWEARGRARSVIKVDVLEKACRQASKLQFTERPSPNVPVIKQCVVHYQVLVNAQQEAMIAENGDVHIEVHILLYRLSHETALTWRFDPLLRRVVGVECLSNPAQDLG